MSSFLNPVDNFEIKLKKLTISPKIVKDCTGKSVCLYFCDISPELLDELLQLATKVCYLNTYSETTAKLVENKQDDPKLISLLTRLTYEQYGELTHPLKMALSQGSQYSMKIEPVD